MWLLRIELKSKTVVAEGKLAKRFYYSMSKYLKNWQTFLGETISRMKKKNWIFRYNINIHGNL